MTTLLVRADFTRPQAWQGLCETVQTPNADGFHAAAAIDDPAYRGLAPGQVLERLPTDDQDRLVAVAGSTTSTLTTLP
ncbi:DUF6924 domain-containing protein [Streptomyces sp. NPDC002671]